MKSMFIRISDRVCEMQLHTQSEYTLRTDHILYKNICLCACLTIRLRAKVHIYVVKYYDSPVVRTFYWSSLAKKAHKSDKMCFYLNLVFYTCSYVRVILGVGI